ncbi:carbonic anhydrase 2-like [Gossypium australe]|uniref:Carbonic anhydrase 2-like n=1 Tax=Gossypium australe TaxID=47621 RepID=A0A5B6UPG3_9ROSI|nr:carbonic anhydrase 2-like [Gossypium australe]
MAFTSSRPTYLIYISNISPTDNHTDFCIVFWAAKTENVSRNLQKLSIPRYTIIDNENVLGVFMLGFTSKPLSRFEFQTRRSLRRPQYC